MSRSRARALITALTAVVALAVAPHGAGADDEPARAAPPTAEELAELDQVRALARRFAVATFAHVERTGAGDVPAVLRALERARTHYIARLEAYASGDHDSKVAPAALSALAELHQDRAVSDRDLIAWSDSDGDIEALEERSILASVRAVNLRETVIQRFPDYARRGEVLHALAGHYLETRQHYRARLALQMLLCSNHRDALQAAARAIARAGDDLSRRLYLGVLGVSSYDDCVPAIEGDRVQEAWFALGRLHRTRFSEPERAVDALAHVTAESASYAGAMVELAQAHVDRDEHIEAIPVLDELVRHLDETAERDRHAIDRELRAGAVALIAEILADLWHRARVSEPDAALRLAKRYYGGATRQVHVREVFVALARDLHRRHGAVAQAAAVWLYIVNTWREHPQTPAAHALLVDLHVQRGDQNAADEERARLLERLGRGAAWRKANAGNARVLAAARAIAEDALYERAREAHRRASEAEGSRAGPRSDRERVYREAIAVLERYLAAHDGSAHDYHVRYWLAETRAFARQYREAARGFARVRAAGADREHYAGATIALAHAYQEAIDDAVRRGELTIPDVPDKEALSELEQKELPELIARYRDASLAAADVEQRPERAAEHLLMAGFVELHHGNVERASAHFEAVLDRFCQTSLAATAYEWLEAILDAAGDTEARARLGVRYHAGGCGDSPIPIQAGNVAERYRDAVDAAEAGEWGRAARDFYRVYRRTKASDARHAEALYRAGHAFARAGHTAAAVDVLARFRGDETLEASPYYAEALLAEARAHERAFDYEAAVAAYRRLADLAKQPDAQARSDFDLAAEAAAALHRAAELRELDRVYYDRAGGDPGATTLYRRHAEAIRDPLAASRSLLAAARLYMRAGDAAELDALYRDWKVRWETDKLAVFHVRFLSLLGRAREAEGDHEGARVAFEEAVAAYRRLGTRDSDHVTDEAAEAQMWIADALHEKVEEYPFRWPRELDEDNGEAALEAFGELAEHTEDALRQLRRFDGIWRIAADIRSADLNYAMAMKILEAPRPEQVELEVEGETLTSVEAFAKFVADAMHEWLDESFEKWEKSHAAAAKDYPGTMWERVALERLNRLHDAAAYRILRADYVVREMSP